MDDAVRLNRPHPGHQGLCQDLATEHPLPRLPLRRTQEDVFVSTRAFKLAQVQQFNQSGSRILEDLVLQASVRVSHGSTLDGALTLLNKRTLPNKRCAGRVVNVSDVLTQSVRFADSRDLADLRTFVTRAKRIDDGAIRLQAAGSVLAAYVCVLRPRLLGEATPTILGLRTMALAEPAELDSTVSLASVLDRLARSSDDDVELPVPPTTVSESWAGVGAPRSGWELLGTIADAELKSSAEAGVAEVAGLVPENPGALVVNNARAAVWGRGLEQAWGMPAGAAFAALALGFLADGEQRLYRNGRWFRISGQRGHVLVRTGAGLQLGVSASSRKH
jgi:hypothetical protein